MGYRKALTVWILVLGVFANTAVADVCFCGEACLHGLRPNSEIKVNLPFHMPCSGFPCKSCKLEQFQKVKEVNSVRKTLRVKTIDNAFILNTPLGHSPKYRILNNLDSFYITGTIPSSPVYLLNLSILL
jgi:hypothetical protein